MISRPWVLVCLLLLIVFSSQFEWKQPYVNDLQASSNASQKRQYESEREESVKEKIILSQEKNIQKLNELVHYLQDQLKQCRIEQLVINNATASSVTELLLTESEQPNVED